MQARRRRTRFVFAALALAAIAWFAVTYKIEFFEEQFDLGYGKEARQNPLLAAELFLKDQRLEVESLPDGGDFHGRGSDGDGYTTTGHSQVATTGRAQRHANLEYTGQQLRPAQPAAMTRERRDSSGDVGHLGLRIPLTVR